MKIEKKSVCKIVLKYLARNMRSKSYVFITHPAGGSIICSLDEIGQFIVTLFKIGIKCKKNFFNYLTRLFVQTWMN